MTQKIKVIGKKRIALVAHDNEKNKLLDWAKKHKDELSKHDICATGTTGRLIEKALGIKVTKFQSGPLGGDQQIGARIAEGNIDFLIFFWDPLMAQPHDPDVKALLRVAVVWNIPVACTPATADFIFSSPMILKEYQRSVPDYRSHSKRKIKN